MTTAQRTRFSQAPQMGEALLEEGDSPYRPGDHLITPRLGYTHHGLYVGQGQVLHYAGLADDLTAGPVELTPLRQFANGWRIRVKPYRARLYTRHESVERGLGRLGEDRYHLVLNNCEHLVTWCITGIAMSAQVRQTVKSILPAGDLIVPVGLGVKALVDWLQD